MRVKFVKDPPPELPFRYKNLTENGATLKCSFEVTSQIHLDEAQCFILSTNETGDIVHNYRLDEHCITIHNVQVMVPHRVDICSKLFRMKKEESKDFYELLKQRFPIPIPHNHSQRTTVDANKTRISVFVVYRNHVKANVCSLVIKNQKAPVRRIERLLLDDNGRGVVVINGKEFDRSNTEGYQLLLGTYPVDLFDIERNSACFNPPPSVVPGSMLVRLVDRRGNSDSREAFNWTLDKFPNRNLGIQLKVEPNADPLTTDTPDWDLNNINPSITPDTDLTVNSASAMQVVDLDELNNDHILQRGTLPDDPGISQVPCSIGTDELSTINENADGGVPLEIEDVDHYFECFGDLSFTEANVYPGSSDLQLS